MGSLLVRNLDENLINGLHERARLSGRSVEELVADILTSAVQPAPTMDRMELFARMDALRNSMAGRIQVPSEELLRQIRDEQ